MNFPRVYESIYASRMHPPQPCRALQPRTSPSLSSTQTGFPPPRTIYDKCLTSLHDNTILATRIHLPSSLPPTACAILAHPYAPLGGRLCDPVILAIKDALLAEGVLVGTFDFRGAYGSGGKTSWTGKPEQGDLKTIICYVISVMGGILSARGYGEINVVVGGYSYGSLIASRVPPAQEIYDAFRVADADDAPWKLKALGEVLAAQILKEQRPGQAKGSVNETPILDRLRFRTSYLLISPLLPPISTMLTLGGSKRGAEERLVKHPTLGVFGDEDGFTLAKKLQVWVEKMKAFPASQFQAAEVEGAGHFWREDGAVEQLEDRVKKWVRDVVLVENFENTALLWRTETQEPS